MLRPICIFDDNVLSHRLNDISGSERKDPALGVINIAPCTRDMYYLPIPRQILQRYYVNKVIYRQKTETLSVADVISRGRQLPLCSALCKQFCKSSSTLIPTLCKYMYYIESTTSKIEVSNWPSYDTASQS